mgnify:CR=1 FL=1
MANLLDVPESWATLSHHVLARGRVSDFVEDVVQLPDGGTMTRQWTTHPGAVAVMALDEYQRVAVVQQYRHPVGWRLLEPPAGILDGPGESPLDAARRELAEEAGLSAADWRVLVDWFSSPGGLQESLRIYLARSLTPVDRPDGFQPVDEEVDMGLAWVDLADVVDGLYAGRLQSPSLAVGTLALALALREGRVDRLRPADAPWPARDVQNQRDGRLVGPADRGLGG